jgi:hypothetical protein
MSLSPCCFRKIVRRNGRRKIVPSQVIQLTELLARAALAAAGYHRHDRGNWRKRRDRPGKADRD